MRLRLIKFSEDFHTLIHLTWGVWAFLVVDFCVNWQLNFITGISVALVASIVPDIDHFLFILGYGKGTEYARKARTAYRNHGVQGFAEYCKKNHKNNVGLWSHNYWVGVLLLPILTWASMKDHSLMTVFVLAWIFHYIFDMLEDMLFFGKINPNWKLGG